MREKYTDLVFYGNTEMAVQPKIGSAYDIPMGYLDRLAALRKKKGLTQQALADKVGVEQPTIQRWEKGKREPELAQLIALANALDVEPGALLDPSLATPLGPRLFIKGEVAAGVWKEAVEFPESDWHSFTGRADVTANVEYRFGLRVVGDSMDQLYPEGTIVECVSLFGRAEAVPGKRVIVLRTNIDGDVEATVKELVEQNGELWLVPRSSNPSHRPIRLGEQEPGIVETRISAIVVASVRPE